MVERGKGGAIVHISSRSSIAGIPNCGAYCASKGALDQVMRVMAVELGQHQVHYSFVVDQRIQTHLIIMKYNFYKQNSVITVYR